MSKPIIGITTGERVIPTTASAREEKVVSSPIEYFRSVTRSGGSPIFLPPTADAAAVEAAMERIDGLLLSGGGDINPAEYGEAPHEATKRPQQSRDLTEFAATRIALECGMPILGICRGIQILSVALGGSLIQDIPSQVPGAIKHNARPNEPRVSHDIRISSGSFLARILGVEEARVNSSHHQSANRSGKGLRFSARAPDGVIEGMELEDGRPILGVQWHPERTYDKTPLSRKLFDWLVAEAVKWRDHRRA